jgi:hypothetical protein
MDEGWNFIFYNFLKFKRSKKWLANVALIERWLGTTDEWECITRATDRLRK